MDHSGYTVDKKGVAPPKGERGDFSSSRLLARRKLHIERWFNDPSLSERETVHYKLQLPIFGRMAETKSLPYRKRRTGTTGHEARRR